MKFLRGLTVLSFVVMGAFALAYLPKDVCGPRLARPPDFVNGGTATEPVAVGAARVQVEVTLPGAMAGYGPLRRKARKMATPIYARAVALHSGSVSITIVELDTLYVTGEMRRRVAQGFEGLVILVASHTHSSVSGFDSSSARYLTAGAYAPGAQDMLVAAARSAVQDARAVMAVEKVEIARTTAPALVRAREGQIADDEVTVVRLGRRAQILVASAHPTLAARGARAIDGDWPGRVALSLESEDSGVVLVLQGSAGNTSAAFGIALEEFARALANVASKARASEDFGAGLGWATATFDLPRPELHRPWYVWPFKRGLDNFICQAGDPTATLAVVSLGRLRFLFVPFEPSAASGASLSRAAGAFRVVSLAQGYAGYLDTEETIRTGGGVSRSQYFSADLLGRAAEAARVAAAER